MSYELLEHVTTALEGAGLRAGEAYPAAPRPEVDWPLAVVALRELDTAEGMAWFRIQVLSPRNQGGWCCQVWAARAAEVLNGEGISCTPEDMEYVSGSDCYCVPMSASMEVVLGPYGWTPGPRQTILCGAVPQTGVESFAAEKNQQRRLVGANWEREPVAVTPGRGGWKLKLVQRLGEEPPEVPEPFTLTVRQGGREHRYTGCCWNEQHYDYVDGKLRLTRQGFALGRETDANG